ncbi:MAG: hypothetical protein ACJ72J_16025, partial [Nitrososphaeraceae archaeon]
PGDVKRQELEFLKRPRFLDNLAKRRRFGIRTESFEYFYHLNAKAEITNWATFEIDKTVSTLYFLSILCYLSFLLIYNPNAYLNNISHIFSIANQTESDTDNQTSKAADQAESKATNQPSKNPRCRDNNCSPINLDTQREAILIATMATAIVAAASIRRLSRRVQIIIIYFTSYNYIIPKLKLDKPKSNKNILMSYQVFVKTDRESLLSTVTIP